MKDVGEFQIKHTITNLQTIKELNEIHKSGILFKEASSVIGPRWIHFKVYKNTHGDLFIIMRKKGGKITNVRYIDHTEFSALRILPNEAVETYIVSLVGD